MAISFTLAQLAALGGGALHGDDARFARLTSDSRQVAEGDLFVALHGERFDGHDYLAEVRERGACAALVSRYLQDPLPQVKVPDTLRGLQQLAGAWREAFAGRLVALTGSNGKTTVKQMLHRALGEFGDTLATAGNLNNEIGVPLTLCRLQEQEFAVVEMGANHAGEIRCLSAIARPDVALITNAARAHIGGFGSLAGVRQAKGEIASGLRPGGCLVLNRDDPAYDYWQELWRDGPVIGFGYDKRAEVRLMPQAEPPCWRDGVWRNDFELQVGERRLALQLGYPGLHNRLNAAAAVAVVVALGLSPGRAAQAVAGFRNTGSRLDCKLTERGFLLIDDCYNANPDSMRAAIDVLMQTPGRTCLVMGDMGELGEQAADLHREIGRYARQAGVTSLCGTGPLTRHAVAEFGEKGFWFDDVEQLIGGLRERIGPGDSLLVKGSRLARMERVVTALQAKN
jgi:UDP-N-acetylmuramoyl-tripeptide--D-alanyl-D-alanine ligase